MKVLEIVLPVLVMILLGMACRKWKLLNQNGIDNMKVLVTQIMLPVAIFHALATSDYNKETGILVGIMFVMLVISFSLGFAMRPLMPEQRYRKYLPFMVSVYERRIFPRSQCWILQGFCSGSVFTWECWDRWRTVIRSM